MPNNDDNTSQQQQPKDAEEEPSKENAGGQSKYSSYDQGCRTPTGQRHKIPAIGSCPPAPKRPRKTLLGKRKASQIQFFENSSGRKEIELFFTSLSSDLSRVAPAALKKRLFVSQ